MGKQTEITNAGPLLDRRGVLTQCGVSISYEVTPKERVLRCQTAALKDTPAMEAEIHLMPAQGFLRIGETRFDFEPESAFGLLDWGRGVWPGVMGSRVMAGSVIGVGG